MTRARLPEAAGPAHAAVVDHYHVKEIESLEFQRMQTFLQSVAHR